MDMSLLLDCYKGCERVTLWLGLDTKTAWLGKGKDLRVMLCSFSIKPTSDAGLPHSCVWPMQPPDNHLTWTTRQALPHMTSSLTVMLITHIFFSVHHLTQVETCLTHLKAESDTINTMVMPAQQNSTLMRGKLWIPRLEAHSCGFPPEQREEHLPV